MNQINASDVQPQPASAIVPPEIEVDEHLDRLDELVSLYFDERLADHEVTELEGLILQDDANLKRYVDHSRLHADLHELFNPLAGDTTAKLVAKLAEADLSDN